MAHHLSLPLTTHTQLFFILVSFPPTRYNTENSSDEDGGSYHTDNSSDGDGSDDEGPINETPLLQVDSEPDAASPTFQLAPGAAWTRGTKSFRVRMTNSRMLSPAVLKILLKQETGAIATEYDNIPLNNVRFFSFFFPLPSPPLPARSHLHPFTIVLPNNPLTSFRSRRLPPSLLAGEL